MRKCLAFLSVLLPFAVSAQTWYPVHSTTFTGPVSAVSAGHVLQDGWIDLSGNAWTINSSNFLQGANVSVSRNAGNLVRPTSENTLDLEMVSTFVFNSARDVWFSCRDQQNTAGNTVYTTAVDPTGLRIAKVVSGVVTFLGSTVAASVTSGTSYVMTFSCVQSGSSTNLSATLTTTGGTTVATNTVSDSTAALQNVTGSAGIFVTITSGSPGSDIASIATYTDIQPATATTYTLAGPGSGSVGAASSNFTVTASGTISSPVTVTPSDGGGGGTFTPSSVTLAAGSSPSATFTYTAASAGVKTISTTNSGGLTDPSSLSYTATSTTVVPVTSAAFRWSPGNWKGDTGRGGSLYRQTWNNGAYFAFYWTASSSPSLTILLPTSSTSNMVSYFLNGVLTDNVAATGNITVTGISPNVANILWVWVRNSTQAYRWNNGANVVQIKGIQLDGASTAGSAPTGLPWVLIVGDSITEGYQANAGNDDVLYDYSFLVAQRLIQEGYDVGISACSGSGWIKTGDTTGDVPAYYLVSGGVYSEASSRWDKIDAGVSLLDSNGQISAFGSTNTRPSLIFVNYATNEALHSLSTSDMQAAVTQAITALRGADPDAWIYIQMPFGLHNAAVYPAVYVTALQNGVSAYQAANPWDGKVFLYDLGSDASTITMNPPYTGTANSIHPQGEGHAYIAPYVIGQMEKVLQQIPRWTHY